MNTPSYKGYTAGKIEVPGAWRPLVAAAATLGLLVVASASFAANSFVLPFPGVQVVDSVVDNLGVTYILGKDPNNNAVVRKYSSAGAEILWPGDFAEYRTNLNLNPTAFCVAPGPGGTTNVLYIVGQNS